MEAKLENNATVTFFPRRVKIHLVDYMSAQQTYSSSSDIFLDM